MIFEIRDLKYATPATVSRAGILFISADDGTQWRSVIRSWLQGKAPRSTMDENSYVKQLSKEQVGWFETCFKNYCAATLRWLKIATVGVSLRP